jgi:transcriptional regulator with XRE-family HTH domain
MDYEVAPPLGDQVRARLAEVMEAEGLGLRALGRKAEVDPSMVRRVLNGEKNPTLEMVDRLFRAAGVTPVLQYE